MGPAMQKCVFWHMQFDQGLLCLLTESLDTTECMNGIQRTGWYFAHVQDDLNLCIWRMFKGTFSLDTAHIMYHAWSLQNQKIHNASKWQKKWKLIPYDCKADQLCENVHVNQQLRVSFNSLFLNKSIHERYCQLTCYNRSVFIAKEKIMCSFYFSLKYESVQCFFFWVR